MDMLLTALETFTHLSSSINKNNHDMHASIIHQEHESIEHVISGRMDSVGWDGSVSAGDTELVREQHTWAEAGLNVPLATGGWTHRLCFTNRGLVLTHKVEAGLAQLIVPQTGSEMGTHHS